MYNLIRRFWLNRHEHMNMKKLLACISQKMSGMWSSKVMKYNLARELLLVITFYYNTSCASWLVLYYLQARKVYLPILAIDYAWQQTNKFIRMHVEITVIKLTDIIWQPNAMIWSEIWIISLCIKDIALVYSREWLTWYGGAVVRLAAIDKSTECLEVIQVCR